MDEKKRTQEDALEKLDRDTEYGIRRPNIDYRPSIHKESPAVKNAWGNDEIPKDPHAHVIHKGARIFFLFALGLCVAAVLFAVVKSSNIFNKTEAGTIAITIDAPPFIDGGTPTNVSATVVNKGTTALELSDLVLTYPQPRSGGSATGAVAIASLRKSLGDIEPSKTATHDFAVTLFGSEGDQIPLTATLEYRVPGSNAIFTKEEKVSVQIRSTPLLVMVDAPDLVVSGQTVPYKITVTNKSPADLSDLIVDAAYPPGFTYVSSNLPTIQSNHLWNIEKLAPGESAEITVMGIINALPLESKVIRASAGTHDIGTNKIAVLLNVGIKTVTAMQSFIGTRLTLGGGEGTVPVQENQRTGGTVTITNSLTYPIDNVVATLTFSGGLYAADGIEPRSGFFDSNTKTITWQGGELSAINAGDTVDLDFDVTPRLQSGVTDRTIKATLTLSAVIPGGVQPQLSDIQSVTGVLATSLSFDAKTQYGGVGPIPPKVGQKTTYKVVIDIANNVNTVTNATLTTKLPTYVTWEGAATSGISYNTVTRDVTWTIPAIPADSGYGQNAVRGTFNVSVTPSSNQVGDPIDLTLPIELMGTDSVTRVEVRHKRNQGLNTTLSGDPQYGSGQGSPVL